MAQFDTTFDARELIGVVREYEERGRDLSPVMAVVAEQLVTEVNDRWMSGGDGEWPGLAPSTLAARRGSIAQILVDTGRAVGSVKPESGADFAEASTDVGYMVFHASDAPRKLIPYRNPFDLKEPALERAAATVAAHIAGGPS